MDGGGDSDQSRLVKTNSARKKTIQRKKEKATHHGRGVGAGVRLLAESPVLQEPAVREVVHHEGHLFVRHVLGAHPTRVTVPAHLAYHVGAALEWENSARHEGGQQVWTSQALRLRQHSESRDGAGSRRRQRLGPVRPVGQSPSRRAGFEGRQVNPIAPHEDALHVKVRLLPQLHRLDQRDGRKRIFGRRPPHRNKSAALSRHARDKGSELCVEELPQSSMVGRTPRKPSHKVTKADSSTPSLAQPLPPLTLPSPP